MKASVSTAAVAALLLAAGTACAQNWPNRPIRFIVTAGPGSSVDVLARVIGDRLRESLGQPVLIDNRPATGGTAGTDAAARSAPDGHTWAISFNGPLATAPLLFAKLPYDPQRDLIPVVMTSTSPNLLAVNAELPVKSLPELIAYARANPGRLTYASVGNATSSHLTMELLLARTGLKIVHSPFNGAPPAAASVAQNETQLVFAAPTALNPHIKSGRVRPIAVSSAARYSLFPEVPTIAEQGFPKFDATLWNGIVVAAGTPRDIVQRLNREVNRVLEIPDVRQKINAAGLDPAGGTPEQFAATIKAEAARWAPLIRQLGVKLD